MSYLESRNIERVCYSMLSILTSCLYVLEGFPGNSAGKESPCCVGDLGLFPGLEDPLEKGKATHFSIWPGEFPGLYNPWGRKESDTTERL